MKSLKLLLLLQILESAVSKKFDRHSLTPQQHNDSQILTEPGGNVTLQCVSPRPWFFCVWEGPQGVRTCGLRDKLATEGHQSLCGDDHRLNITGMFYTETMIDPYVSDLYFH